MRVLGIDPGSRITGYGILESLGSKIQVVGWGIITLKEKNLEERLGRIFEEVKDLIEKFSPQEIALEQVIPETFPQAALKLGQAQGAAILAAYQKNLPLSLYHPLEIKQALTGYGKASKEQVAYMIKRVLGVHEKLPLDASDALSVALHHIYKKQRTFPC